MDTGEVIKKWARDLRAIAQTGSEYGSDIFDKERYAQLNTITDDMLSYISGRHPNEIAATLPVEAGYATPKIAVRGVIMKDGKILMVREAADGKWTLPGGWCDIGLTSSENVVKEIQEESGLKAKAVRLLAFFDQTKYRSSITMQHIYTAYYQCEVIEGQLKSSIETIETDFFDLDSLPPLSEERMTHEQLYKALSVAETPSASPYFD